MATVALVGTLDTKGQDYAFLAGRLRAAGAGVIVVDAGTGTPSGLAPDIPADQVAAAAGTTVEALRSAGDRGAAVTAMGRGAAALVSELAAAGRVDGVLAAGGSGGSSIAAQVMAALPVGLPKLLVSTMASGDVRVHRTANPARGQRPAMTIAHVRPGDVETFSFEWGTMKWFVSPVTTPGAANSQGEVIVNPGQGHARHQHDQADELIYVISGSGVQTVGDEEFTMTEGDVVYIPMGTPHSTMNTDWRALRLIVTYTPGGEEQALTTQPGFARHPAGDIVGWTRSGA